MKPTDKAILGMVSKSPGRNASEPIGGLENEKPRRPSPHFKGEGSMSWGKLLGDSAAVTAMLDRLLHHGHILKCGPRSWRTKTGLPTPPRKG